MILTVEHEKGTDGEIAICFDTEGLSLLLKKLSYLADNEDHLHLMTETWGGDDLTEAVQGGDNYRLVHSLRLVRV
ncbi:immunity protein 32 [Rhizobium lusitanum]|uniref:Imm32 family immunity protein n=1 Tax=Rhizobium lusitanum TaxID=293958 RepID=UPI00160DFCA4|nr:Imm32 family immunity protein [Rhizobium lusitanum]QND49444.1 immunity protein 32 [Rhizobium lusitanum]